MSWLKAVAERNIPNIVVTWDTFHCPISWLKALVLANILRISFTADTFQLFKGYASLFPLSPLLNAEAPSNIFNIVVTWDTSQLLIFSLKVVELRVPSTGCALPFLNNSSMSLTALTSQVFIGPYVPVP